MQRVISVVLGLLAATLAIAVFISILKIAIGIALGVVIFLILAAAFIAINYKIRVYLYNKNIERQNKRDEKRF